jgi:hypothetical protein
VILIQYKKTKKNRLTNFVFDEKRSAYQHITTSIIWNDLKMQEKFQKKLVLESFKFNILKRESEVKGTFHFPVFFVKNLPIMISKY